jgi:hypothetical protein
MLNCMTVPVPVMKCEIGSVEQDVAIVDGYGLHLSEGDLQAGEGTEAADQISLSLLLIKRGSQMNEIVSVGMRLASTASIYQR